MANKLTPKQITFYLLKGYTQPYIDCYQQAVSGEDSHGWYEGMSWDDWNAAYTRYSGQDSDPIDDDDFICIQDSQRLREFINTLDKEKSYDNNLALTMVRLKKKQLGETNGRL
tara:strand:+ start:182 stop:520 length:339 start_codon:yes stop_codon:yes gene_type:complete